jgi:hypothetical protein
MANWHKAMLVSFPVGATVGVAFAFANRPFVRVPFLPWLRYSVGEATAWAVAGGLIAGSDRLYLASVTFKLRPPTRTGEPAYGSRDTRHSTNRGLPR